MNSDNKVTIVIPVKDDKKVINCINSIDIDYINVLVVLNGASDSVKQSVIESGVQYVEMLQANSVAACNLGFQKADTEYVLFMDSDCTFIPGMLQKLLECTSDAEIVTSNVKFECTSSVETLVAESREKHINSRSRVNRVPLLIYKGIVDKIGGYLFDERLSWTEDYELSVRLRNTHVRILRIRDYTVKHSSMSIFQDLKSLMRYGIGHYTGYINQIMGYRKPRYTECFKGYKEVIGKEGFVRASYGLLGNICFVTGFYIENLRRNINEHL